MTNMQRNKERLMHQIMALAFAQNDLVLFLDTHPQDAKALREYHKITPKLKELKKQYTENYGPITVSDVNSTSDWTWVNAPWPWEN